MANNVRTVKGNRMESELFFRNISSPATCRQPTFVIMGVHPNCCWYAASEARLAEHMPRRLDF